MAGKRERTRPTDEAGLTGPLGSGVIQVPKSAYRDAGRNRLHLADADERASTVRVYSGAGRYAGPDLPTSYFPNQSDGIALDACADGIGYVVATNQVPTVSHSHVFDRASLRYLSGFCGAVIANGIALESTPVGPSRHGAFFAVHDDRAVAAFDWGAVLEALGHPWCSHGPRRARLTWC